MLLIPCPWCGPRNEMEFSYGHEGHIARPPEPEKLDDEAWGDYVFLRKNPKGVHYERWLHARGCRRWFNVARHTVTHEILAVYKMGEPKPNLPVAPGKSA
jgi:sarcosine oxidase, subunit delta